MAIISETAMAADAPAEAASDLGRTQKKVLLAATIGAFVSPTPALLTVYGIVMVPIAQEFGWPRAQVAGVLSIAALLSAITLIPLGWLLDRIGPRRIVLFGITTFAAAMAAFSLAPPQVGPYYALFITTVFFGTFTTPIIYSRAIAGWFEKGRGAALGFSAGIGNGAGATLIPILAGVLLTYYGWRVTYQGVALLVFALGFPIVLTCLRAPPLRPQMSKDAPVPVDGLTFSEAMKTRTFWLLAIAVGLCAACLTAMFTQIVPVAMSRGLTLTQGVMVITVFSMTCALWQWAMGFLLDRIKGAWILAPFYVLAAAGLLLLQYGEGTPMLILAGILMGLGLGAEYSALPLLVSRYFGLRSYGRIVLTIYSAIAIVRGIVPLMMNLQFDATQSYGLALHVIQAILIVAALSLFALPARSSLLTATELTSRDK
ncbi:MFS transporter [Asticcacaulis sp. ZE23SCel15]|uniref:MFS transporter n=1 Tax=Asticcacaulis sp. ZE23SCel15 TaxID=3059027 RepID=UPI00265E7889|nr:MFS transporter [Asticcacaulis sp. ZE23SCel15]WKL57134.1 MFS transporter [Asticcacaulis sp. ZE23SCel15]